MHGEALHQKRKCSSGNMVGEIVGLRILGCKFYEGQGRGHHGDDNGRPGVAFAFMAVGCVLKVFVCLLEFFAHQGVIRRGAGLFY